MIKSNNFRMNFNLSDEELRLIANGRQNNQQNSQNYQNTQSPNMLHDLGFGGNGLRLMNYQRENLLQNQV